MNRSDAMRHAGKVARETVDLIAWDTRTNIGTEAVEAVEQAARADEVLIYLAPALAEAEHAQKAACGSDDAVLCEALYDADRALERAVRARVRQLLRDATADRQEAV